jgi:hypothetical protein
MLFEQLEFKIVTLHKLVLRNASQPGKRLARRLGLDFLNRFRIS